MAYNLERRQSPRKRFDHLLYVEVEPGNGGMVLNFSEHGFGFRAVKRVRPKEEVKFAFNLADQRRLEGRGRLEWTDKEGRVAGLQFTEISDEFRAEMRKWLCSASPEAARSPRAPIQPPPDVAATAETQQIEADRTLALRRRDALLGAGGPTSKPVRSIASMPTPGSPSTPAPLAPAAAVEKAPFIPDNPDPSEMPWAAMLPPALGTDRKPTLAMPPRAASPVSPPTTSAFGGATAFDLSAFEPLTEESLEVDEKPAALEELRQPLHSEPKRPSAASNGSGAAVIPAFQNPIAAVEARTADALNDHAQALLKHFQVEEQRMSAAFRENAARIMRDSERQLFPIRESVQAQIKSLESSVASAAASAKVLDQYPSLLERAQQQALERFKAQMQEIMHAHVMELRRRSESAIADVHALAATSMVPQPRRISASTGVIVTAILVALLALLFMFRGPLSQGFIWVGQQMVEPTAKTEKTDSSSPVPSDTSAAKTSQAPAAAPAKTDNAATAPSTPATSPSSDHRDVHSLWADVAKGDVSAQMTLGTMYYTGHGVTKNCFQARRLFSAAARKGNDEAKQKLAEMDNGSCGG
jgi:PilZ domain-containing protein